MTPADTAKVLAKMSAFDQRTIGEADVVAWHEVIGGFNLQDCLEAVTLHYRETSQRAMPADIRKLAMGIRDRRKSLEAKAALDPAPAPRRSPEVEALIREVAEKLPKVEFDDINDIQARAIARARRERRERERGTKAR